jgi:hypothetical protein
MLEKVYEDYKTLKRYRNTRLGECIEKYLERILKDGYSKGVVRFYLQTLYDFSEYIKPDKIKYISINQIKRYALSRKE